MVSEATLRRWLTVRRREGWIFTRGKGKKRPKLYAAVPGYLLLPEGRKHWDFWWAHQADLLPVWDRYFAESD